MRRLLALVLLSVACAKPTQPPAQPVSADGAPGNDDGTPTDSDSSELPLVWQTIQVGETEVEYATVGTYHDGGPVMLALPPGRQSKAMVVAGLEKWASAMVDDGWFVMSPVSPAGSFVEESAAVLPAFLDEAAKVHGIPTEGLVLFGMSNGGLSAFALAIEHPGRFRSLVTMPGRAPEALQSKVGAVATMPVTIVVGAQDDPFWTEGADVTAAAITEAGGQATVQKLPDTQHAAHLNFDWPALRTLLDG